MSLEMALFIRPYRSSDFEAVAHICRATLPESLSSSPEATHLAPYVWAHQYTHLSPEHCFVLEDPAASPTHPSRPVGSVVGYVVGTRDIASFVARYGDYVEGVLSKSIPRPPQDGDGDGDGDGEEEGWTLPDGRVNPACLARTAYDGELLLREGREGLCAAYPATLHIDILDGWRGGGWGARLMERFLGSLPGGTRVHVAAAGTNTRVVPFYERFGFGVYPGGERSGSIWMVRDAV